MGKKAREISESDENVKAEDFLSSLSFFLDLKNEYPIDFELHLLWTPDGNRTYGQGVGRYSLVEVSPDENIARTMEKYICEMFYCLCDEILPADKIKITNQFFKDGLIEGPLAYNLFYESLAAAAVPGLFFKRVFPEYFDPHKSWNGDPNIDAYGKALFPLLEEYVQSGETIKNGFVLRAVEQYKSIAYLSKIPRRKES